MSNPFIIIYDWLEKRRTLLYCILVLIVGVSGFYASRIRLQEDISSFFQSGEKDSTNILDNFKLKDRILIMVTGSDPDEMVETAHNLADSVQPLIDDGTLVSVITGVDQDVVNHSSDFVYNHLPIFLDDNDYLRIESGLTDSSIVRSIERYYALLTSPSGLVVSEILQRDPLNLGTHLLKKFERFSADIAYKIYDDHIFNEDMTTLFMFLEPTNSMADTAENERLVSALEKICEQSSNGRITVECIGAPVVAVGNARQIKQDTLLTLSLALLLILPLFYFCFRNRLSILFILLPPLFGALLALAIIAITKGTISVIAIGAGAVVLGISLSYSIHIIVHNNHVKNPRDLLRDLVYPLTIGCFTTIGAFVALLFTDSSLLQDMGLFASLTLIGTTLFSLVFLPHFLGFNEHVKSSKLLKAIERYNGYAFEKNSYILIGVVCVTIVSCFFYDKVEFDRDISSMNYESRPTQEAEQRATSILGNSKRQIYVVTSGNDQYAVIQAYSRLHELYDSLKNQHRIDHYVDIKDFIIDEQVQRARISKWSQFWGKRSNDSMSKVIETGKRLGFAQSAFEGLRNTLERPYEVCPYSSDECENSIFSDWVYKTPSSFTLISKISIPQENKDEVYQQIAKISHTTIIDRAYFSSRMIETASKDFNFILMVTSLLVFLTLLLTYGRIEIALLTFLPMCISWIIILGMMSLLDIRFNIVNILLATFIFGLGDDFSIFTMDGLLSKYKNGSKLFEAHKSAIFISALTTIIGMGVLVFAKHPAIQSIAVMSVLGLGIVVIVSFTIQPYLFNLLILGPTQRGGQPYTFVSCFNTIYAFSYFTIGCVLLNVIYGAFKLWPTHNGAKQRVFHSTIHCFIRLFLKSMYMADIKYQQMERIDLKTPSVIIANHQSFVDILLLLSLSPKIVMVTKGWVWRSPILGPIVRYAGCYTIEDGYEKLAESLSPLVKAGYSVVVFPEGTRSEDCEIKRFHKGAFYLAEKLQLKISSIVIYGTGLISSKKQPFYIKSGDIIVKALPEAIEPTGATYQDKAKYYNNLFRREYDMLREMYNRATNTYNKQALIKNYIYKGPVLEWYMRIKCKLDGYYNFWDRKLPRQAKIIDMGCGYGQLCLVLGLLSPKRELLGIDYDPNKIAIANNCFLANEHIRFQQGDMRDIQLPAADAFIFNDSLHYLDPSSQEKILTHCLSRLDQHGVIFIREGDSSKETKHKIILKSEIWSTRIMKFNKAEGALNFISSDWVMRFAQKNNLSLRMENCDRSTSQTLYILTKR